LPVHGPHRHAHTLIAPSPEPAPDPEAVGSTPPICRAGALGRDPQRAIYDPGDLWRAGCWPGSFEQLADALAEALESGKPSILMDRLFAAMRETGIELTVTITPRGEHGRPDRRLVRDAGRNAQGPGPWRTFDFLPDPAAVAEFGIDSPILSWRSRLRVVP
jgi:hypothetical protein